MPAPSFTAPTYHSSATPLPQRRFLVITLPIRRCIVADHRWEDGAVARVGCALPIGRGRVRSKKRIVGEEVEEKNTNEDAIIQNTSQKINNLDVINIIQVKAISV